MSTAKKARYILSATTTSWKKTRGFFLWVSLCSMCDVYIQLTVGDCIRFDFVGVPDYGMWGKNKHKTHTKHNEAAKKYDLIARNYSMDEQEKQKHTAQAEYTEEQRKNNRVFIHNLLFVFFSRLFFARAAAHWHVQTYIRRLSHSCDARARSRFGAIPLPATERTTNKMRFGFILYSSHK